jgi:hypothetical protein
MYLPIAQKVISDIWIYIFFFLLLFFFFFFFFFFLIFFLSPSFFLSYFLLLQKPNSLLHFCELSAVARVSTRDNIISWHIEATAEIRIEILLLLICFIATPRGLFVSRRFDLAEMVF